MYILAERSTCLVLPSETTYRKAVKKIRSPTCYQIDGPSHHFTPAVLAKAYISTLSTFGTTGVRPRLAEEPKSMRLVDILKRPI